MKNKIVLIFFLLSILLYFGCDKKEKDNKVIVSNNNVIEQKINYKNGDEYTFKYGFTKGKIYKYKILSKSQNVQIQGDQSQTSNIEIQYILSIDPIEVDSSGEFILKVRFNSIKVNAVLGNQIISYDSENPADTIKKRNPAFAEYVAFQHSDYNLRLGINGEVLEIFRVDNILNNILGENIKNINDNLKNQLRTNIEYQLKSISQQMFQYLPEKSQKLNSTWSKTTIEKLGEDDAKNIALYRFLKVEPRNNKEIAIINAELQSETKKRQSVEKEGVKYEFDKPKISGSGVIEFDLENGMVTKKDLKTNFIFGMKITKGGQKIEAQSKVNNSVLIELIN